MDTQPFGYSKNKMELLEITYMTYFAYISGLPEMFLLLNSCSDINIDMFTQKHIYKRIKYNYIMKI
jgi:hypothetical protein